ncbi:bifunctional (p)ppGpp synthetase/guanosine-3',5'-bis(diphosphate) 3'-pyrophosphohydrolase [Fusibacter paucivorans]|uniref:Bifunctional (P)ppGpp synthetase/guanosine-3',5'-bis(Diphosphate) 3'-pyrophosphohydrolase n=1 Tax=Fusibacter paucivorans TaxID=76009 RepID=A0ABS5PQ37_9FIRM|nr:HD domain-containing protein [Fusibacter paucivorans]MBS7527017.1 bifunctional (p)ppGpp synthetase/guanosine-3',5'-bis(diphosphate) 3'-pyrophosphohydrolase [Fusibacter paucivorans]
MILYQAIHTALKAHDGQIRKLDLDLYAAHPIEVGMILSKYGFSDDVICAGILHDTLEDTPLIYDDLIKAFGKHVADLVNDCTEQDKSLDWQTRKKRYLAHLETVSDEVRFIVCVDKLTNLKSIHRHLSEMGDTLWTKFNAGFEQQSWYYHAVLKRLAPIRHHALYRELASEIDLVFPANETETQVK